MNMEMHLKEYGKVLEIQNQYKGKAKEVQWQMYDSDGR